GSIMAPNSFLVLAKDRLAFHTAFGNAVAVFDEFKGSLQSSGEQLKLLRPGATANDEIVVDEIRYENQAPWPAIAANSGISLQRIDPTQDGRRVANWGISSAPPLATPGVPNSVQTALAPFSDLWINEVAPEPRSGIVDSAGQHDPWIEIYNAGNSSV